MNKYKKRIKRATALLLAAVTTATSSGLDWGTLQAGAEEITLVDLNTSTMVAKKEMTGSTYVKLSNVSFDVGVPATGPASVNYTVRVFDMGSVDDYPTGGENVLGTASGTVTYNNGTPTSSLIDMLDMYYAAEPTPDRTTPDGTTPDGTTPDGTTPDGTTPDGTTPDGTTPDGTTPDGTTPDGTTPDNTTPAGEPTPGSDPATHIHTYIYTDNGDKTHTLECACGDILSEAHDLVYVSEGDFMHKVSCTKCDYSESVDCDVENISFTSNENGTHTAECSICGYSEVVPCLAKPGTSVCAYCGASTKKDKGASPLDDTVYVKKTINVSSFSPSIVVPSGTNIGIIVSFSGDGKAYLGGAGALLNDGGGYIGGVNFTVNTTTGEEPDASEVIITAPSDGMYVDVTGMPATIQLAGDVTLVDGRQGVVSWEGTSGVSFSSTTGNSVTATIPADSPGNYTITAKGKGKSSSVTVHAVTADLGSETLTYTRSGGIITAQHPSINISPAELKTDSNTNIAYAGDEASGTATATISVGGGALVMTRDYVINKRVLDADEIKNHGTLAVNSATKDITYTGGNYVLGEDFVATIEDSRLTAGKIYFDVKIKGINNCSGEAVIANIEGTTAAGSIDINDVVTAQIDPTVDYVYNLGAAVDASIIFKDINTGAVLSDFGDNVNIICSNNTTATTATCTITGKDNFKGTMILYYDIEPLDLSTVTVEIDYADKLDTEADMPVYRLDGTKVEPSYVVKVTAGTTKTLEEGSDYTSQLINNNKAGIATHNILGEGNYTGSYTGNIKIISSMFAAGAVQLDSYKTSVGADGVAATALKYTYNGSSQNPGTIKVFAGRTQLALGTDYNVTYATDAVNVGEKRIIITGVNKYKGQELIATYEITPYNISTYAASIANASTFVYDGQSKFAPKNAGNYILAKAAGYPAGKGSLTEGTDFDVTLPSDMVSAGTKTVTYTGKGNFTGTQTANYEIAKLDLSTCVISKLDDKAYNSGNAEFTYTGNKITPAVAVRNGAGVEFTTGFSYREVIGSDYRKVGKHTFKIVGDGNNISGTLTGTFKIVAQSIGNLTYEINGTPCTGSGKSLSTSYSPVYDGRAKSLKGLLSVYDGSTKLTLNTDYRVVEDLTATAAGSHDIKIYGLGNYEDSTPVVINYTVDKADVASSRINVAVTGYELIDGKVFPKISLTDSGKSPNPSMTRNTDYRVVSTETSAGLERKATIEGMGNYKGTREVVYDAGVDISNKSVAHVKLTSAISGAIFGNTTYDYTVYYGTNPQYTLEVGTYDASNNFIVNKTFDSSNFTVTLASPNYPGDTTNSHNDRNIVYATIKGIGGDLFGSQTISYQITPGDLSAAASQVSFNDTTPFLIAYTGSKIVNPITAAQLTYIYGAIASGDVKFDPVSVGPGASTGVIKVKDNSENFKGEMEIPYEITIPTTALKLVDLKTNYYYTGFPIQPAGVQVKDVLADKTLVQGKDFIITYENNTDIGLATIKVEGRGDYAGATIVENFNIVAIDLAQAKTDGKLTVTGLQNYYYTGLDIEPEGVAVYYEATQLVENRDYIVVLESDKKHVGKKKYTVKAKVGSKYDKEAEFEYKIIGDISDDNAFVVSASNPNLRIGDDQDDASIIVKYANEPATIFESENIRIERKTFDYPGNDFITVTGIGCAVGTVKVPVTVKAMPADVEVKVLEPEKPFTGSKVEASVDVIYRRSDGSTVKMDPNCYTVSYSKNTAVGVADIAVTIPSSYVQGGVTRDAHFDIYYDITDAKVVLDKTAYDYDGSNHIPAVNLYVDSAKTLEIPASCYDVFVDGQNITDPSTEVKDAGAHNIVVKAKTGQPARGAHAAVQYKINGKSLNDGTAAVDISTGNIYSGSEIKPAVTVTYNNGSTTLVENKDYTLRYINNINATTEASKATVIVTGIGNYQDTIRGTFDIAKANIKTNPGVDVSVLDVIFAGSGNKIMPEYTITYNGKTLYEGTDFDVELGDQKVSSGGEITFIGKNNFEDKRKVGFVVEPADISQYYMQTSESEKEYTGKAIAPEVNISCTIGGKPYDLVLDRDYEIAYVQTSQGSTIGKDRLVNVGKYTIQAIGKGSFTGTIDTFFTITKADLATEGRYTVTLDRDTFPLDGSAEYKPVPTIVDTVAGKTLVEGADYSVSYKNNTSSGSKDDVDVAPTVVITALSADTCNYQGSREVTFNIGTSIAGAAIAFDDNDVPPSGYTYDGKPHVPKKERVTLGGKDLVRGVDYEIVPQTTELTTNRNDAVPYVIKGIGEYYGTEQTTYRINPKIINQGEPDILIKLDYAKDAAGYYTVYDGDHSYEPGVTVFDTAINKRVALVEGVDYSISYENNTRITTDANRAYAVVTFNIPGGNYSSEGNVPPKEPFRILSREITGEFTVKLTDDTTGIPYAYDSSYGFYYPTGYTYSDGAQIIPEFEVYYRESLDKEPINLTENKDYDVTADGTRKPSDVDSYKYPGKYHLVVVGKTNYNGSVGVDYLITGDLANADVTVAESDYTGERFEPSVTVKFGDHVVAPEDLDITYVHDTFDPTKGSVIISGKPGVAYLGGSQTVDYELKWDPSVFKLVTDKTDYQYTGQAIEPVFTVTTTGGEIVPFNRTDIVYVGDHTNVGNDKVAKLHLVLGKNSVDLEAKFNIVPGVLTADNFTTPEWMAYQGGKALQPSVTGKNSAGYTLTNGVDYTYELTNAAGPGICKVNITGIGNYTTSGVIVKEITIKPSKIGNLTARGGETEGTAIINWTGVAFADGYKVTVDGVGTDDCKTTSDIFVGLDRGKDYTVSVTAYKRDSQGVVWESDPVTTTVTTGMGKATVQSVTSNTTNTATITFNPSSGANSVYIYRSTDNVTYKLVAIYPKNQLSYTDKKLTSGAKYYYKVAEATYKNGQIVMSDMSNPYTVTVK